MSLRERVEQQQKILLGVVHLLALPGAPRFTSRSAVRERALRDAEALLDGGLDGFVVENFGDAPFAPDRVSASTVAEMSVIVEQLVRASSGLVGVNVLRNDAESALSIAAATGATFIRVNVHTGVAYADQGTLEGRADQTLRLRRQLECDVEIVADVAVKHALVPFGFSLEQSARDTAQRGLADALVVTGPGTGQAASLAELRAVRAAVPQSPLFCGSGITESTIAEVLSIADGVIVGSWLKAGGDVTRPVDCARVKRLVAEARSLPGT
jgi:uncharacterized protein